MEVTKLDVKGGRFLNMQPDSLVVGGKLNDG